jgi:putative ABC transport system permease protein
LITNGPGTHRRGRKSSTRTRSKQIGTRRTLGATRFDIVRFFMVENWLITSIGITIGIAGMVALWVLGQLAVLVPARRAANIPPAIATRSV